jgi:serine/threonine-protein kinase
MATDDQVTLAPGTAFGNYTVVRLLGSGGMGSVYEARHRGLDKRVALKTLHRGVADSPDAVERFLREGRIAASIHHPHVVDVSDVGSQDGVPYLVMEFLEGESLEALLEREGALSLERTVDILLPVCAAMATAHDAGVVHRDLKPANIFLAQTADRGLHPKVVDFGISKPTEGQDMRSLTNTSALMGTPSYMSPEQLRGSKHVDARADQYSLGVTLYECLTGRLPFEGETLFVLFQRIGAGEYPSPRVSLPDLPTAVDQAIERAMKTDAAQRHPDVRALGRELLPFASSTARAVWSDAFRASRRPPAEAGSLVSGDTHPQSRRAALSTTARSAVSIDPHATLTDRPARTARRVVVGSVVVVALVGSGWLLLNRTRTRPAPSDISRPVAHPTPVPPMAVPEPPAPPTTPPPPAVPPVTAATHDAGPPVVVAPPPAAPPSTGHAPRVRRPAGTPASAPTPPAPSDHNDYEVH